MLDPPADFAALQLLIASRRPELPRRLAQVAEFVIAQPHEVALRRVGDVASRAGVQPSTLVRFAQALGYAGFSDLQAVLRAHARARWPEYGERLEAFRAEHGGAASTGALLAGFLHAAELSVQRLGSGIDLAELSKAAALLCRAETIGLLAARRSFAVAVHMAYALRRLGLRCELVDHMGGLAAEQAALLRPHDALLVVSFTPYAPASVELAAAAHKRGVPVVAITDSPFSPLIQAAQVWLEVAEADHLGFRSLAATLAVATTLAVAVAQHRGGDGTGVPF